jgi:hypothetical protein
MLRLTKHCRILAKYNLVCPVSATIIIISLLFTLKLPLLSVLRYICPNLDRSLATHVIVGLGVACYLAENLDILSLYATPL